MNEQLQNMAIALSDAGCGKDAIEKAEKLLQTGRIEDLVRHLRFCRCDLMDDLHMIQKKVDCMDYLIRQAEKDISEKKKGRQRP